MAQSSKGQQLPNCYMRQEACLTCNVSSYWEEANCLSTRYFRWASHTWRTASLAARAAALAAAASAGDKLSFPAPATPSAADPAACVGGRGGRLVPGGLSVLRLRTYDFVQPSRHTGRASKARLSTVRLCCTHKQRLL